ncbi:hypothetical protein ACEWAL_07560 [Vibrio parahaemolyticus]|nr:hypothetical protein [Vibrio parahaemolyticus]
MKLKTLSLIFLAALAGCQSTIGQNVPTDVRISIYNDIKHGYSYRPTFAIADKSFIQINSTNWKEEKIFTSVTAETADATVAVIDKYLAWNKQATENQHILEKKIAKVGHFTYTFFSGNENNHFLVSQVCEVCESVFLDRENVIKWKQQIIDWQSGRVNTHDISSEYK